MKDTRKRFKKIDLNSTSETLLESLIIGIELEEIVWVMKS